MSTDDIVMRVAEPHEYKQVVQFVIDYFGPDEPLCSIEPKVVPDENNLAEIVESVKDGNSILAVKVKENGEEELVGINIGIPRDRSCVEEYYKAAEKEGNTKYGQIVKLLAVSTEKADLFNRYGVDKLFLSYLSCVKPTYRGKNLGTRLKVELMALAKRLGYKLVTVDCSSYYSASVCKRMGWDVVNFTSYKDYVDENNQPIFNPPAPHEGMTTLAVRL